MQQLTETEMFLQAWDDPMFQLAQGVVLGLVIALGIALIIMGIYGRRGRMMNRGKVIKGLECCVSGRHSKCPYIGLHGMTCLINLQADALALIREQREQLEKAEPVMHGRWVDGKVRHIKNGELRNMRECSECGACYFVYDAYNSAEDVPQYCPNCGARMDEGDDDAVD